MRSGDARGWLGAGRKSGRRGQLLLDAMIGIFMMALTSTMVIQTQVTSLRAIRRSRYLGIATQTAREQLDRWRGQGYDALPLAAGAVTAVRSITPPAGLPGASGEVVFTRLDENLQPTSLESRRVSVTATVRWTPPRGRLEAIRLTSLVTKTK